MKNEPEKWQEEVWSVPHNILKLKRQGEKWYLTDFIEGVRIPIESRIGEILATHFSQIHAEEDWIDRHSWQFRWLRFWYRRKKKREARKLLSQPSTVKE